MRRLVAKTKAILGTGAFGGLLGGIFGGSLLGVGAIVAPGEVTLGVFAAGIALSSGAGAFIATAFAAFLALSPRRELGELGVGRSALLGAAAGAVFPLVAATLTGGWLVPLVPGQLALLGGVFGTLGAALSVGLVRVAKDAPSGGLVGPGADGHTRSALPAEPRDRLSGSREHDTIAP